MKTCPKLPLSCPEGCGESNIPRNLIDDHLENHCPLAEIFCPFKNNGCLFKVRITYLLKNLNVSNLPSCLFGAKDDQTSSPTVFVSCSFVKTSSFCIQVIMTVR